MDRRKFLHRLSHAAAAPSLFSSFAFDNLSFSKDSELTNTINKGKILIIINMNGGNDGLNTLIPLDQYSNLNSVRPHVIIPENKIISLEKNDLGLHPSLTDMKTLFREERFKIIQSVGYPKSNFSHFRSMDIWLSGSGNEQFLYSGWLARYLEKEHTKFPYDYPNNQFPHPLAIEIASSSSLLFTGEKAFTSFVTEDPYDFFSLDEIMQNQYSEDLKGSKLSYLQLMSNQSQNYGNTIREISNKGSIKHEFPRSHLGSQFSKVNLLITGGANTRIYYLNYGGFDTHGKQVDPSDKTRGAHSSLLKELNDCISTLYRNLDETGDSDRILGMTISEFGRTIHSNATDGTDHGSTAPMFLFGNKIDPTILGYNPVVPSEIKDSQHELDLQFDYRDVFSSVIDQWLGGKTTSKDVFGEKFDQLPIIQRKYIDTDGDGVSDERDLCNATPLGAMVNTDGCEIFSLPADTYSIQTNGVSCSGKTNGVITISISNTEYTYNLSIPETEGSYSLTTENQHQLVIEELKIGSYTLNFTVEGQEGYLQTFEIGITEPPALSAKSSVNQKGKTMTVNLSGSDLYYAEVNGERRSYKLDNFTLQLRPGMNTVKISTPQDCQGVHVEQVFISEQIKHYPNPVQGELNLVIPGEDRETTITIYSRSGSMIKRYQRQIPFSRIVTLNTTELRTDVYVIKVNGQTVEQTFKIIKR